MKYGKMITTFLLLALLPLLLWQGSAAAEGVRRGLALCYRAVLPALFPGMVVCGAVAELAEFLPLPPAWSLWGTSQLCGFPTGIRSVARAYRRGILPKEQALRLSACCGNASPAFLTVYVGRQILGSLQEGILLAFCQFALSLLLAVGSGALTPSPAPPPRERSLTAVLAENFSGAAVAALTVAGYVAFFSMLAALPGLKPFHGFLELTGGIRGGFYTAATMVGFSGCAVLLQNVAHLSEAGLSPLPMLAGRAVYTAGLPFFGFLLKHLTNF